MKKFIFIWLFLLIGFYGFSQTTDSLIIVKEKNKIVIKGSDTTRVSFGKYKIILVEEDEEIEDASENKEIEIDSENHPANKSDDDDDDDDDDDNDDNDDDDDSKKSKRKSFKTRTNWGGLSFGILQLESDPSNIEGSTDFINLESGSSWAWEFLNIAVPIGSPYMSLSTGLGYRRDKFQLANDYRILSDDTGIYGVKNDVSLDENILKDYYLEVPLMLNISTSTRKKNNVKFSLGYIQKIGIKTKANYKSDTNGYEKEEVVEGDFEIRKYTGSMTARIGYKWLNFYGNYGLNSVFKENKGPILDPFTLGITIRVVPVINWGPKYKSSI